MERKPDSGEPTDHQTQWGQLEKGPEPELYGGEHDVINTEIARNILKKHLERRREIAPEQVKMEARSIATINRGFIKQRERDRERGRETSDAEFQIWENDYTQSWNRLQKRLQDGGISDDQEAELESEMFFTKDERLLHETVDAQCGKYYHERNQALRVAIETSDSETKETDLRTLSNFYASVAAHLEYKYMSPEDIRYRYGDDREAFETYDRQRTDAHNSAIEHLNALNELAHRYGTHPFTPRNYWTSRRRNQTPAVSRRMRYDRDVVEEYYAIAFSDKVAAEERRLARRMRGY